MAVTLLKFRARFPEFADNTDAQIELYLSDSVAVVNANCNNADLMAYYLTAHLLDTVGKMNTVDAEDVNRGAENLIDTGDVKTSYHKTDSNDGDFDSTIYGKNYKRLEQQCKNHFAGNFVIA
jgi:hypothetical protein